MLPRSASMSPDGCEMLSLFHILDEDHIYCEGAARDHKLIVRLDVEGKDSVGVENQSRCRPTEHTTPVDTTDCSGCRAA